MKSRSLFIALMTMLSAAYVSVAIAASAQYKIVTASEKGTYIVIGRDLATYIAAPVDIELESFRRPDRRRTSAACATSPE